MRIEYFAVTERQHRGHAHLHVLARGGFIPQAWLSRAAERAGFGPVVDIRSVGKEAAGYVAKHLTKEMGNHAERLGLQPLPRWHRRATWSLGWAPHFVRRWAAWREAQNVEGMTWYLANGRPVLVADRLQTMGYELDPIDYGERPPREQVWELRRQEPLLARPTGERHAQCWLCATHNPAARRPHQPEWSGLPAPPEPSSVLWADA